MQEKLRYSYQKNQNNKIINDIWDGEKVSKLRKKGWFSQNKQTNHEDFGIILGTDGGLLFKRTGIQAWPIWGIIANLLPEER